MNAHCERFNHTLQELFIDYHEDVLFIDVDTFNRAMVDWPVFYNTERSYHSLSLLSPDIMAACQLSTMPKVVDSYSQLRCGGSSVYPVDDREDLIAD